MKTQKDGEADGYTLKIRSDWKDESGTSKHLEMGLALANDRLFVRALATNITSTDSLPRAAYLPPFAGITAREELKPPAIQRRLIGQGLAGAVLRNLLLGMFEENESKRAELLGARSKIPEKALENLRKSDPWELLLEAMRNTFQVGLRVHPFNPLYHSYIRIDVFKGAFKGNRFYKHKDYNYRDLMVEGSGLLQWLSVYALALAPGIDILLLDEPDAHLHPSLQSELFEQLDNIAESQGKQVLIATHSPQILSRSEPEAILEFRQKKGPRYLKFEEQKVAMLAGMGSDYAPRLNAAQRHRRILFVEGKSDVALLTSMLNKLSKQWPQNLVIWPWAAGHRERKRLFEELAKEIQGLRVLSLRDRDDEPVNSVQSDLLDKGHDDETVGFTAIKWRRRHIEGYLLCPDAIARAAKTTPETVRLWLADTHALAIPAGYTSSSVPQALLDANAKRFFLDGESLEAKFGVTRHAVADALEEHEICEDISTFLVMVESLCS